MTRNDPRVEKTKEQLRDFALAWGADCIPALSLMTIPDADGISLAMDKEVLDAFGTVLATEIVVEDEAGKLRKAADAMASEVEEGFELPEE